MYCECSEVPRCEGKVPRKVWCRGVALFCHKERGIPWGFEGKVLHCVVRCFTIGERNICGEQCSHNVFTMLGDAVTHAC